MKIVREIFLCRLNEQFNQATTNLFICSPFFISTFDLENYRLILSSLSFSIRPMDDGEKEREREREREGD